MTENTFISMCQDLGFQFTPTQNHQLLAYLNLLYQWNQNMNLVGPFAKPDILRTLLVDSFHLSALLHNLPTPPKNTWDLGAGAGLPGLPLRILWQHGSYWLVEARQKRSLFMATFLARNPLPQTQTFHGRVEQFMPNQTPADLILSRAFMPWPQLLNLIQPFLAPQGQIILLLQQPLTQIPPNWSLTTTLTYPVNNSTRCFVGLKLEAE